MANVLAQEAFDAFAEFLDPVNVFLLHSPIRIRARFERRDFLVDLVIPGNIRDQIFDHWERLHGQDGDGLVLGQGIHAGFAGEPWSSIHFR